jgi:uncharacterized protein (DUF58 family)
MTDTLKWTSIFLVILSLIIGVLWYALGGVVLGAIFGLLLVAAGGIIVFAIGMRVAFYAVEEGASIAHRTYASTQNVHPAHSQALALLRESARYAQSQMPQAERGYLALPDNSEVLDAVPSKSNPFQFVIHNLNGDEE